MCGYCIEGAITLDFIERQRTLTILEFENNWVPIYLQESTCFPDVISKINTFDNFPGSIDVAFCRLWEMFLYQHNGDIYNFLVNEYGTKAVNAFLAKLKNNCDYEEWESLGGGELYINRECWEQFLDNRDQLIENSESTLKSYYNFWIRGENKETSDPKKRMEETGIMDPIENTTPNDWDRFYSLFPVLYFSFLILTKYKRDAEIISLIASESPHDLPDFFGYDLWLQRKAFVVCMKNYGIQFVLDNYDKIRLELIYYSLLKESICVADLDVLKSHLLLHEHWANGVDSDSVIELINISMS